MLIMRMMIGSVNQFVPATIVPSHDVCNRNSDLIHFMWIRFWLSCMCMLTETSMYYSLYQGGCPAVSKIDMNQLIKGSSSKQAVHSDSSPE